MIVFIMIMIMIIIIIKICFLGLVGPMPTSWDLTLLREEAVISHPDLPPNSGEAHEK